MRGAGVSKKTFYEHFADKLDCFLAAYEAASDELLRARARGAETQPATGSSAPAAGIHAYLRWLAAEPALARVFLIEIAAAGPEALERRERVRDRYAERMRDLQTGNSVPEELFHAVVAAADDLVVRRLRAGERRARAGGGNPPPPARAAQPATRLRARSSTTSWVSGSASQLTGKSSSPGRLSVPPSGHLLRARRSERRPAARTPVRRA